MPCRLNYKLDTGTYSEHIPLRPRHKNMKWYSQDTLQKYSTIAPHLSKWKEAQILNQLTPTWILPRLHVKKNQKVDYLIQNPLCN
jgi:hypothetical protein